MRTDLISLLHGAEPVAAVVGRHSRHNSPLISWVTRPNAEALPAITLSLVSLPERTEQRGRSLMDLARVQIDIFANSVTEIDVAQRAVRDFLTPPRAPFKKITHGSTTFVRFALESMRDLPVDDLPGGERVYHSSQDYMIYFTEAASSSE